MRKLIILGMAIAAGLAAQYPRVAMNSSGHVARLYNAAPTWPDLSAWTWTQQQSASATLSTLKPPSIFITAPGNDWAQMFFSPTALPSPPYTVILGSTITQSKTTLEAGIGIVLRNSSLDTAIFYEIEDEASVTGTGTGCCRVFSGVYEQQTIGVSPDSHRIVGAPAWAVAPAQNPNQRGWIKIVDDGVHRTFYYSTDDATTWTQHHQDNSGQYVTPNQYGLVGYSIDTATSAGFFATIWQYTVTQP